jgi:protein-disulfide isomerase
MFRKCRAALLIISLSFSTSAFSQELGENLGFSGDGYMPYTELPNQKSQATRGLDSRVLYFVDFQCPFCRGAHRPIEEWATTLPSEIDFEVVPVIGTREHLPAAMAFYAVLNIAPKKMPQFQAELYSILQDSGRSPGRRETFVEAAGRVGIEEADFISSTQSDDTKAFTERAFALTKAYGLNEVPTIVVANRFMTAPQRVQHQMDQFITVMNGLVSMVYSDIERERMR